jgi:2-oxoglutarate dehydrogenase E1 component
LLYKLIAKHQNPRDIYAEKLLSEGVIDAGLVKSLKEYKDNLDQNLEASRKKDLTIIPIHAKRMERFEQVSTINVTK